MEESSSSLAVAAAVAAPIILIPKSQRYELLITTMASNNPCVPTSPILKAPMIIGLVFVLYHLLSYHLFSRLDGRSASVGNRESEL